MATISVQRDGDKLRLRCRTYVNGKRRERKITLPKNYGYRKAQTLSKDLEVRWKTGDFDPWHDHIDAHERSQLLVDLIDEYIHFKISNNFWTTDKTIHSKSAVLNKFVEFTPKLASINEITEKHLQKYLDSVDSIKTKKSYKSVIIAFWNWLIRKGITKHKINNIRLSSDSLTFPSILTPDELEQICSLLEQQTRKKTSAGHTVGYKYRHYYRILFYTGMRPGEMMELKVRDVNLRTNLIHIGRNKTTKTKRQRNVYIFEDIRETLHNLTHKRAPGEWLTPDRSFKEASKRFTELRTKLFPDKDVTMYNLRHSHGCWLLERGFSLEAASAQLGHTSTATTSIYAQMTNRAIKNEFERTMLGGHKGGTG